MQQFKDVAVDVLQYGWDHPGLLAVSAIVSVTVGYVTWRRSGGGS